MITSALTKPTSHHDHVEPVFSSLESGIPVSLIATFKPLTCDEDDLVSDVLSNPQLQDFDYIPVKASDSIVGVLIREAVQDSHLTAGQAMKPLHESMLIASEDGLLSFVREADSSPFRLVLQKLKINGIVTLSDLQKLAVRPVLFSLVTTIELLMAQWLRQNCADDEMWLSRLSDDRRQLVEDKWQKYQQRNMAIDRITTTEFGDKARAVLALGGFPGSKKSLKKRLEAIRELRDSVAHAGDFALTTEEAQSVAQKVRWAEELIETLQRSLQSSEDATIGGGEEL